jgi:hypothetical protein
VVGSHLCSARRTVNGFVPFTLHDWLLGSKPSPRLALTLLPWTLTGTRPRGYKPPMTALTGALDDVDHMNTFERTPSFDINSGGALAVATRGKGHVGGEIPIRLRFYLFSGPCVGSLNGEGKRGLAELGRPTPASFALSSTGAFPCSTRSRLPSAEPPLSLVFSHILCFKTPLPYPHTLHTHFTSIHPSASLQTAHPGISRIIPPPISPSPASTKSSGRGLHQSLSLRLS